MTRKHAFRWAAIAVVALLSTALASGFSVFLNDRSIASEVLATIKADPSLAGKLISPSSANGTVTLSGKIDTERQRITAQYLAGSVMGVQTVINNLQMIPAAAAQPGQPAAGLHSPPETSGSVSAEEVARAPKGKGEGKGR